MNEETRFEVVAEKLFESCQRHWKDSTRKVNRSYFRNQILPWFRGMQIAGITKRNVKQWFTSLHATPFAADRAAPVLSILMRRAELHGYRPEGSNPCVGIRRYRRRGRERFLSPEEMQRLGAVLDRHENTHPLEIAAIRILLLTGCRRNEILSLKWSDYREGRLYLRDSKTGPRTVFLSPKAKAVIERQPRSDSSWVFPSPENKQKPRSADSLDGIWKMARKQARIEDVRLHDLRHSVASQAVLKGVPLPVVARLLGHSQVSMTLRYAHVAEREVEAAAERVGRVIADMCGISDP